MSAQAKLKPVAATSDATTQTGPAPSERAAPAIAAVTPLAARQQVRTIVPEPASSLRILTCGSVDDGKSTLIGRLLWDTSDLYDDQRATIAGSTRKAGDGVNPDFSALVDGLVAEREQGITIDIAWRYFDTQKRRIVVIDSPGHEQYTRNMASGASHADAAIMLVDARFGLKRQTRRHAAILQLVGLKRVVLAVNKMDLVDWSQDAFRAIESDFHDLAWTCGFEGATVIPVAGPSGDNVARRSERMPWYTGPTLVEHLETLPARVSDASRPFRLAVQTVLRDGRDFRGLAGTISSGTVKVGDAIVDVLSGQRARVARIVTMDRDLTSASAGQAVTLQPDRDLDIARGAVLSPPGLAPTAACALAARLVWLSEAAFDARAGYLLRTATDLVPVSSLAITALVDLETLETRPATTCGVNDIAEATIRLGRATALDAFGDQPETGSFVLVDAVTGASVAGGVVVGADATDARLPDGSERGGFRLTREILERGVCRDLADGDGDREEFGRRAREVAILLRAAGVDAILEV